MAHLLNLDVDVVFVDTTSTYWEMEVAGELAEAADRDGDGGDEAPQETAERRLGHSKDHRDDLPQVVIAMAVTRDGIPVRCWTFPGNEQDQKIIRTVKDDLSDWNLRLLVRVADRGFASAANRAYLARGGGHYIHAEKLRNTNAEAAAALARQGRYHEVAGNLRVKEVWVPARDAGQRAGPVSTARSSGEHLPPVLAAFFGDGGLHGSAARFRIVVNLLLQTTVIPSRLVWVPSREGIGGGDSPCPWYGRARQTVDAYASMGRAVQVPRPECPSCSRPVAFWSGTGGMSAGWAVPEDLHPAGAVPRVPCYSCAAAGVYVAGVWMRPRLRVG